MYTYRWRARFRSGIRKTYALIIEYVYRIEYSIIFQFLRQIFAMMQYQATYIGIIITPEYVTMVI